MWTTRFARASFILILFLAGSVHAGDPTWGGRYTFGKQIRTDPPVQLFIVTVDLTDPKVHVRVAPGGPDPDGPGEWETKLMQPTAIAARENFDIVVNGDFFAARNVKEAEGAQSQYRPDQWAAAVGPAVTDGRIWSTSKEKSPCFVVHRDPKAKARLKFDIEPIDKPPADAWEVIAGGPMLVQDGKLVPSKNKARHPRTAIGLDKPGKTMIILVVDGRRPGVSIGMTFDELSQEMLRLGCWQAVNLDGGGSSVMAIRDIDDRHQIVNTPSDGRERAVANVLGISWERKTPASKPAARADRPK